MIQLRDVAVNLHNSSLWNNLNLTFDDNVNYLIHGPNGSGKTTLLKLLSGNLRPKGGVVHYSFIPELNDWDERYQLRKQLVHFIPTHALHDVITSHDFYYQQRYYTIEGETQTVRQYLGDRVNKLHTIQLPDSFNIDHLLNLEMTRLSNGQIKKVIILSQLLDSIPKVLLLDYPFEGLDADSRKELSEFLDHLSTEHSVQLIVADHDDPQLLKSVSKVVDLGHAPIIVHDRTSPPSLSEGGLCGNSDDPQLLKSVSKVVDLGYAPIIIHDRTLPLSLSEGGLCGSDAPHPSTAEPVVEMRDVTIRYGDKVIIDKLNWTIRKGERWALTGRNGSGKTTLFSLIFADHPMAYSEKVFLFGKRRGSGESIWDIKRRISYLGPEQLHFLDSITENKNVREYLMSADPLKMKKFVDAFDLTHLLERKLNQLSNGELQLVLLMSLFAAKK
jgi:molybdate transport system ATP-binding protein